MTLTLYKLARLFFRRRILFASSKSFSDTAEVPGLEKPTLQGLFWAAKVKMGWKPRFRCQNPIVTARAHARLKMGESWVSPGDVGLQLIDQTWLVSDLGGLINGKAK